MKRRWISFCIILFVLIATIPVVQGQTDQFSNSLVIVMGKCNSVSANALWLFGPKLMLNKRVTIASDGEEGERINALILPSKFGLYVGHENMVIQMDGVTGLVFWGEKSFLLQKSSPRIFVICKARDTWITYP